VLQRGDRARAAHVHGGGEAERLDAEVRRELLAGGEAGRGHDAVDRGWLEARVRDRFVGGAQHQLDGEVRRTAHVLGFADAGDRGAAAECRSGDHGGGS
jgi:hypothetical protein